MGKKRRGLRSVFSGLRRSSSPPVTGHVVVSTSALVPPREPGFGQALRPASAGDSTASSLPRPPLASPSLSQLLAPAAPVPEALVGPHEPSEGTSTASGPQSLISAVSSSGDVPIITIAPALTIQSFRQPQEPATLANPGALAGVRDLSLAKGEGIGATDSGSGGDELAFIPGPVLSLVTSSIAVSAMPNQITQKSQVLLSLTLYLYLTDSSENQNNLNCGKPSLWEQAFNRLSEADKQAFPLANKDKKEYIKDILEATKKSRDICQERRLKFTILGKTVIVRDVADKLLTWAEKFSSIGDCAVQYDPVHAALPWAGVRFLLQIAINHKETMGVVMIGVERIAKPLVRCTIYELLYLKPGLALSVSQSLESALEDFYSCVLEFLAFAKRYLETPSPGRMLQGLLDVEGKSRLGPVEMQESLVLKEVSTAEAECRLSKDVGVGNVWIVLFSHLTSVELLQYENLIIRHSKFPADRNKKLHDILRVLEKPIARIDLGVEKLQQHLQGERRSKILQWISQIEYEKHHQNAKDNLLSDTGQWLQVKEEFCEWQSSSASGILWLHGIPGAGKTKLVCAVIDLLKSMLQRHEPVVYFYCNRNESQRRDPTILMQAIVKQLSVVLPNLPELVVAEYDEREKRGLATGSFSFKESCDLVLSLLNLFPQTIIIIDALDESDIDERWRLLEALKTIVHSSQSLVKIFVSSRDDVDIKLELDEVPNLYIRAQDNSGDIERFVRREVVQSIDKKRLLRGKVTNELKDEIISAILGKADGMFQWAALQITHLCKMKFEDDIRDGLGALPKSLEEAYSQIWDDMRLESTNVQRVARRALMWVMCAIVPLDRETWAEMSYWPKIVPEDGLTTLFDVCRNLVTWDKRLNRVVFAHLSVWEYLERNVFSSVEADNMAGVSCLSVLTADDQRLGFQRSRSEWKDRRFLSYSVLYWPYQVERAYDQGLDIELRDLLKRFLGTPTKPSQVYGDWLSSRCAIITDYPTLSFIYRGLKPSLSDSRDYLRSDPPNPLLAMSCFRFGELKELWECDGLDINSTNRYGQSLLLGAVRWENEKVTNILLKKGADLNVGSFSEQHSLLQAAIKVGNGKLAIELFEAGAGFGPRSRRYANMFQLAAENGTKEVMEAIAVLDDSYRVTEALLVTVARRSYDRGVMEFLLSRDPNLKITEPVLVAAAGNHDAKGVMNILLTRDSNLRITELVLVAAARSINAKEVMNMLLTRDSNLKITEPVLVAAAGSFNAKEVMNILLTRDSNLKITELVLVAAAGSINASDITNMLLTRDSNLKITEPVLVAAAGSFNAKEVMNMLLTRESNLKITEPVLVAAVGSFNAKEVMNILLTRDSNLKITEPVLVAAAGNHDAKGVMNILLTRDSNLRITELVLVAAAGSINASDITNMLLTRDSNLKITEPVLVVAARSPYAKEVMNILLTRDSNLKITEPVLVAAAGSFNAKEVMNMLLTRDSNLKITEPVLIAAMKNSRYPVKSMEFLLFRNSESDVMITEEVLLSAAAGRQGKELMEILLRKDANVEITEPVLVAAAGNLYQPKQIIQVLLARGANLEITKAVRAAAAENNHSREVMKFLLARDAQLQTSSSTPNVQPTVKLEDA